MAIAKSVNSAKFFSARHSSGRPAAFTKSHYEYFRCSYPSVFAKWLFLLNFSEFDRQLDRAARYNQFNQFDTAHHQPVQLLYPQ